MVQTTSVTEKLLNEAKKKKYQEEFVDLPDILVSVFFDSQATREQGETPGIPESDFILALLWTVT